MRMASPSVQCRVQRNWYLCIPHCRGMRTVDRLFWHPWKSLVLRETVIKVHFRPRPGQVGHCFCMSTSRVVTFRLYGAGKGANARHNSHQVLDPTVLKNSAGKVCSPTYLKNGKHPVPTRPLLVPQRPLRLCYCTV